MAERPFDERAVPGAFAGAAEGEGAGPGAFAGAAAGEGAGADRGSPRSAGSCGASGSARRVMTMLPAVSIRASKRGDTKVVVWGSTISAGPRTVSPATRSVRR